MLKANNKKGGGQKCPLLIVDDNDFCSLLQIMGICERHRNHETAIRLALENTCKACEQEKYEILLRAAKDIVNDAIVRQDINAFAYVDLKEGSWRRFVEIVGRS